MKQVLLLLTMAMASAAENIDENDRFRENVLLMARVEERMRQARDGRPKLAAELAKTIASLRPTAWDQGLQQYLQAKYLFIAGDEPGARRAIASARVTKATSPILIYAYRQLGSDTAGKEVTALLTPVSHHASEYDINGNWLGFEGRLPPVPDRMPGPWKPVLSQLAKIESEPWRQQEALANAFGPGWFYTDRDRYDRVFGANSAASWEKLSLAYARYGDLDNGRRALAIAVVLSSGTKKRIARLSNLRGLSELTVTGPDKADVVRAARLYVDVNAHPRAASLIETHKELLKGDYDVLHQEIVKDWQRVMRRLTDTVPLTKAYGVDVPADNTLPVVPEAYRDDAVAELARRMRELKR